MDQSPGDIGRLRGLLSARFEPAARLASAIDCHRLLNSRLDTPENARET